MTPCLSVVMAVKDCARHLPEALASILNQSWRDFEFIIIDDGSTDESRLLLERLSDPRVVLLRNAVREGLARSLNRGWRQARGRYIARMDGDDVAHLERFSAQLEFLEKRADIAVLGSACVMMDDGGTPLSLHAPPREPGVIRWAMCCQNPLPHPSAMLRRHVLEAAGGYDESFTYAQDYDLWSRLIRKGERLANLERPLLRYRLGASNISTVFRQEQNALALRTAITHTEWLMGAPIEPDAVSAMRTVLGRFPPPASGLASAPDLIRRMHRRAREFATVPEWKEITERSVAGLLRLARENAALSPRLALRAWWAACRLHPRAALSPALRLPRVALRSLRRRLASGAPPGRDP